MPSAGELQQAYAAQNASTNALSQVPSRLPALEEDVQLQPVNTASTASSQSDGPRAEPNALSKSISAVSAKFGFGRSKKGKDKAQDKAQDVELEGARGQAPDPYGGRQWTNYSSNMVDVLDTLGATAPRSKDEWFANENRPRSPDPHIPDQHSEFALRSQPGQICQSSPNVRHVARPQRKAESGGYQSHSRTRPRRTAGLRTSHLEAHPDRRDNGHVSYH